MPAEAAGAATRTWRIAQLDPALDLTPGRKTLGIKTAASRVTAR